MGYIRDLERELRDMLTELPSEEAEEVVRFVKAKVYESYKNGRDGTKPESAPAPTPEPEVKQVRKTRARRVPVKRTFRRPYHAG